MAEPIVLPPQTVSVERDGARPADRLGPALRQRPDAVPIIAPATGEGPDVVIDAGGLRVGDDGSVSLAAAMLGTGTQDEDNDFGANLADTAPDGLLAEIAAEIADGIEADIRSRSQWIEQYRSGIDLLGVKMESAQQQGRGISKAGEPLMLEAMVEYQAAAEAEMLPAMGPVKVPTIGRVSAEDEALAKDFQDDLNYYLTEIAKEYYPDTASMLMHQAFCGLGYKKVYYDPIRRRPVSESVLAPDLIVSDEATDLDSALRVTHSIQMLRGQLRRMQLVGEYRDIDLGQPAGQMGIGREAQRAILVSQGLNPIGERPQDQPYEIWECDTDIDIDEHELIGAYEKKTPWGLPLPYKVTLERHSRRVLGIRRNWRPDDRLYTKRNMYVRYGLIPSLGFHCWGFLHLLGNQTRNLRSITRLLIDKGMLQNFPGGIKLKGARTATNEIAPRPGEFVDIDAALGPQTDIRKMFMPMPYGPADPTFIQFREMLRGEAEKLAGTVKIEVGEGRTNVPVGTMMAMLEQAVQVMAGVHKRNHRAQKEELRKLRELFAENPEDLSRLCRLRPRDPTRPERLWRLAEEFADLNLVPASDPNVPSQLARLSSANALVMLAAQFPQLFDVTQVARDAVQAMGRDPDRYVVRQAAPSAQAPQDPRIAMKAADLQQKAAEAGQKAQGDAMKLQLEREKMAAETARAAADNQTRREVSAMHEQGEIAKLHHSAALLAATEAPVE